MSSHTLSTFNSETHNAPKLHDDRSNWADYHAKVQVAMEAKGLWKHVEGKATLPKPYAKVNGIAILSDGKTQAMEEQIEAWECRIDDFAKAASLAKHIILSMMSAHIGMKIKTLTTAKEMWDEVKKDATAKSMLYLVDVECQLEIMRLSESSDPKTHLTELKLHFQLMMLRHKNLLEMGSSFSKQKLIMLITSSLPNLYWPTLQTLTAADRAAKLKQPSTLLGVATQTVATTLAGMSPCELMDYFIEEAEHHAIEDNWAEQTESVTQAQAKKNKGHMKNRKSCKLCVNCDKSGNTKEDCWALGGGKEGQGPNQQKQGSKWKMKEESTAKTTTEEVFAFTCTSTFIGIADSLKIPPSKCGVIVDSGMSSQICPDKLKFINLRPLEGQNIHTTNDRVILACGIGDVSIELSNSSGKTKCVLKDTIYVPEMALTLISVAHLDLLNCSTTFMGGQHIIWNPKGAVMATLPLSNGLYHLATKSSTSPSAHANIASAKMTIQEAHLKFGHIAHDAIKYAVTKGLILGIELDLMSKPEFCDACAKAKASHQLFPKILNTWAEQYGERVFWDLWGPVTVHSQSGNFYMAARTDDHTHEMKLYFLKMKDQTFEAYKQDEAYLETHSGNHIKWMHSDQGGEFLSKETKNHQDLKGTLHELTVHDSPQKNGVAECGNWTWAEQAHAMLILSGLPWFLWEEATSGKLDLKISSNVCSYK